MLKPIIKIKGQIFSGTDHGEAIQKAFLAGALSEAEVKSFDREKRGMFMDEDGKTYTRDEAQKKFGLNHSHELPQKKGMKIIWFTYDGIGFPICYKLFQEGNTVIVAQIQTAEELGNGTTEKPKDQKKRLENFDGVFDKYDARKVLKKMQKIKDKDDWFVFFDFNMMWKYADIAQKIGFKNGFFPTKEDFELESDRNKAKEIVRQHYPDLNITEVHEFKQIQEAIEFLSEQESVFVLKGNSEVAKTFVPSTDLPELAKQEIIDQLEEYRNDYEKDGFILEEKVLNPIELTPEIIFYNGAAIATALDIENKPLGCGNLSQQTGCASCLVIKTDLEEKINQIAFPPFVYDYARKHRGMFVWDASILVDPLNGKMYFGEFCANRLGWDSIFNELMMSESVTDFFRSIMEGKNPYTKKFGVSVRGFNLPDKLGDGFGLDVSGMSWLETEDKKTFLYELLLKDKVTNSACGIDLAVFASAADNIPQAVNSAYKAIQGFSFSDMYYRPKSDFNGDYPTAILKRYEYGVKEGLYAGEISDKPEKEKKTKNFIKTLKELLK